MSYNRKNIIEKYGDVHLHSGPYPIPVNEAAGQDCSGSCYYGESWPQQEALANSIDRPQPPKLIAVNNSPDPSKRYALVPSENVGGEIGVGCMNTRCMCPNCHGSCSCGAVEPNVDEQLMYNKEVKEPFEIFGLNIAAPKFPKLPFFNQKEGFTIPLVNYEIGEKSIGIILAGLILFLAWYFMRQRMSTKL